MYRRGRVTHPRVLGKPGLCFLSTGNRECEAKLCLRRFAFILSTLGVMKGYEENRDTV